MKDITKAKPEATEALHQTASKYLVYMMLSVVHFYEFTNKRFVGEPAFPRAWALSIWENVISRRYH